MISGFLRRNFRRCLLVAYSAFTLLISACCQKQVRIPSYVLPKDEFTALLTDMALAESAAGVNIKNVKAAQIDSIYNFNPLVDHGISKEMYDSTLSFYAQHPDLYKEIYQDVLNRLSIFESERLGSKVDSAKSPNNIQTR